MYTNTSCTLYLASQNYQRITVSHCFLTHRRIAASSKLGLEYAESAFVMINGKDMALKGLFPNNKLYPGELVYPYDSQLSCAAKKGLYPSEKFYPGESVYPYESQLSCEDLVFTEGKDFMVEGFCQFMFDNSSEKGFSDSVRELNSLGAHTIMIPDWKGYGRQKMRHWELSCK